jgi:hypothetical protein
MAVPDPLPRRRARRARPLALACALAAAALAAPASAEGSDRAIVSRPAAGSALDLRDVEVRADGSVTGTLVNPGPRAIRNVRLLVLHTFAWRDERHPGDESPGRAGSVHVPGEIAPGSAAPFAYAPEPPLPARADGRFETSVAVQSFTEVGP